MLLFAIGIAPGQGFTILVAPCPHQNNKPHRPKCYSATIELVVLRSENLLSRSISHVACMFYFSDQKIFNKIGDLAKEVTLCIFVVYRTCSTFFLYLQAHSKKLTSQIQSVVDELETHVDPFDLDVFAPYIRDRLARQTQRANVRSVPLN